MPIFSRLAVDKVSQNATPHASVKRETALREWNKIPATPGSLRPNASAGSRTVSSKYNTPKKDLVVCAEGLNGKDVQAKQAVASGNRENRGQTPAGLHENRTQRAPRPRQSLPEPANRGSTIKTPSCLLSNVGSARKSSALVAEERAVKQTTKASKLQTVFKRSFESRKSPDVFKKRASTTCKLVDGDKVPVSTLGMASYWLAQVQIAESEGKHGISMGFFRLALDSSPQLHLELFDVLKSYLERHPQNICSCRETLLLYEGFTGNYSGSSSVLPADFEVKSASEGESSAFYINNNGTTTACRGSVSNDKSFGLDGKSTGKTPDCNGDSINSMHGMEGDNPPHIENSGKHDNVPYLDRVTVDLSSAKCVNRERDMLGGLSKDTDVSEKVDLSAGCVNCSREDKTPASTLTDDGLALIALSAADQLKLADLDTKATQEEQEFTERKMDFLGGMQVADSEVGASQINESESLTGKGCSTTEVAPPVVLKLSTCAVAKASGVKKSKKNSILVETHSYQPLPLKGKRPRKVVKAAGVELNDERSDGSDCLEVEVKLADTNPDNWSSIATISMSMTGIQSTDIKNKVYDTKQPQGYIQAYAQGFVTVRDNPEAGFSDDECLDNSPLTSLPEPNQQKDIRESTVWPELSAREGGVDSDKGHVSSVEGIKQHTPISSKENELKGLRRYADGGSLDVPNLGNLGDSFVISHMEVSLPSAKDLKPRRGVHFNDVPIILRTPSPHAGHTRISARSAVKATPNVVSTLSRKGRARRNKDTPYKEVLEVAQEWDAGILGPLPTQESCDPQVFAGSASTKEPGGSATNEVCVLPLSDEHVPEDIQNALEVTKQEHQAGNNHSILSPQMAGGQSCNMRTTCLLPAMSSSECGSLDTAYSRSLDRVPNRDTPNSGGQIEGNKNVKPGQKQSRKLTVTSPGDAAITSGSIYTNSLGTPGSVRRSARLQEAGNNHQTNAATPGSGTRRSARTKNSCSMQHLSTPESTRKHSA